MTSRGNAMNGIDVHSGIVGFRISLSIIIEQRLQPGIRILNPSLNHRKDCMVCKIIVKCNYLPAVRPRAYWWRQRGSSGDAGEGEEESERDEKQTEPQRRPAG